MTTFSTENTFTPRQVVHKIFHFSDTILRKSLDFLDQFLLLHGRNYSTRLRKVRKSRTNLKQVVRLPASAYIATAFELSHSVRIGWEWLRRKRDALGTRTLYLHTFLDS